MRIDIAGKTFGRWFVQDNPPVRKGVKNGVKLYWWCRCECGTIQQVSSYALRHGKSKSCGCLGSEVMSAWMTEAHKQHRMCKATAGPNRVWRIYRNGARIRGFIFELTRQEFDAMIQGLCHYCGAEPTNTIRTGLGLFKYNGIDRMNSTVGYVLENCVSCCGACNLMKMDLNRDEFISRVKKIVEYEEEHP